MVIAFRAFNFERSGQEGSVQTFYMFAHRSLSHPSGSHGLPDHSNGLLDLQPPGPPHLLPLFGDIWVGVVERFQLMLTTKMIPRFPPLYGMLATVQKRESIDLMIGETSPFKVGGW